VKPAASNWTRSAVSPSASSAGCALRAVRKSASTPQVDAGGGAGEPAAAAAGQSRQLGDLRQAQRAGLEGASRVFLPGRHGQLNVVDPDDAHDAALPGQKHATLGADCPGNGVDLAKFAKVGRHCG